MRAIEEDPRPALSLLPFGVLAVSVFALLLGRAAELQLGERASRAQAQVAAKRQRVTTLQAPRGRVLGARGQVLAEDRLERDLLVTPSRVNAAGVDALALRLGLGEAAREALRARLAAMPPNKRHLPVVVRRGLTAGELEKLRGEKIAGVQIEEVYRRHYPGERLSYPGLFPVGRLFSPLLGHVGRAGAGREGKAGVERRYDEQLRGAPGRHKEPSSRWVKGEPEEITPATPGRDVELTIDGALQKDALLALLEARTQSGAAIVLNPKTGAVLASVSIPAVSPGVLPGGHGHQTPGDRPWLDRTRQLAHPPGALVTPFVALAASEEDLTESRTCKGYMLVGKRIFRCTHSHGKLNTEQAIAQSCLMFSYDVGANIGLDALGDVLRQSGMVGSVGYPLGEPASAMPNRAWYGDPFRLGFTLASSVGQGNVRVSPLGVAVAYAALANGGRVLTPRLEAASPITERGRLPSLDRLPMIRRALVARGKEIASSLTLLEHPPHGVAATRASGQVSFQQEGGLHDVGWFAGWAPADEPEAVVVVRVETGERSAAVEAGMKILDRTTKHEEP